jgi:hypothetical protein
MDNLQFVIGTSLEWEYKQGAGDFIQRQIFRCLSAIPYAVSHLFAEVKYSAYLP